MSKLFGEFKTPSISDWKKLAAKELKGANIDELNLWQASDGFQAKTIKLGPAHSFHPGRYWCWRNASAFGQLAALRVSKFQSSFWPTR